MILFCMLFVKNFRLMEKKLRKAEIPEHLLHVFATTFQSLVGDKTYNQLSNKINRLLESGKKKGFDYDQILDSKPGKSITEEIMLVYREEMERSGAFKNQLKNNLDRTLVESTNPEKGDVNIEELVDRVFNAFVTFLNSVKSRKA